MNRPTHRSIAHAQNALRSAALVDRLLAASSLRPGELILDLGAGAGLVSKQLVLHGCLVVAVEQDPQLAAQLRERFAGDRNIRVIQGDILAIDLPRRPYKVFANIPFNCTADIVNRLTRTLHPPEDAYLVVQSEAAGRFAGQPSATLASVLLFSFFEASIVHAFRRTDFVPVPRVESLMLRLHKRGPPLLSPANARVYRDFIVSMFTQPGVSVGARLTRLAGHRRGRAIAQVWDLANASPTAVPAPTWLQIFMSTESVLGDGLAQRVRHAEQRLRWSQRRLAKLHRTRSRRLRPPPDVLSVAGIRHTDGNGSSFVRRWPSMWLPPPGNTSLGARASGLRLATPLRQGSKKDSPTPIDVGE